MSKMIFASYESDAALAFNKDKYYFIQLGAYKNYDMMVDNSMKIGKYIYMQNELYYVFTCITLDKDNIDKIKSYYKESGYDTLVKEFSLSDNELYKSVSASDSILKNTNEGIDKLCEASISKYKEG